MGWGWYGWWGPWPGHGPFSYLPPWLRPGWVLWGRGWRWWWYLYGPYGYPYGYTPTYELKDLEEYKKLIEEELKEIERRIDELRRSRGGAGP